MSKSSTASASAQPSMTLAEYLRSGRDTAAALARRVEVTAANISSIVRGKSGPGFGLAHRIQAATGGAVRADELMEAAAARAKPRGRPRKRAVR